MVYVSSLDANISIYPAQKTQIALSLAAELLKHSRIKKHALNLKEARYLSYRLIYTLKLKGLKTLKIYIKINFANGFI